jgi:antitoxin VapB
MRALRLVFTVGIVLSHFVCAAESLKPFLSAVDSMFAVEHDTQQRGSLMAHTARARVFMNGRSQHVTIPAEFRFSTDEVYVQRDPKSGGLSLSERPPRALMADVFVQLDEAGAADFVLERDLSLPPDQEFL